MKKFSLIKSLMLVCLWCIGMGAWAEEATMTAGTNGYEAKVNENDAIKVGTGSAGGSMTITVPAGAISLDFYAAAWSGVTGLSLNITPTANVSPTSVSLTADTGISGNSPFTLSGIESNYKFTIALSNITQETTLTLTSSAAKRFVVWGATYTSNSTPTHTARFSVDGVINNGDNSTVKEGQSITFPSDPEVDGVTFMGWTKNQNYSNATTAPSDICKSADMGNADVTYYAVFAHQNVGDAVETKTQTLQYDTWTYSGSTTDKSSYRLFHSGSYIESASFDRSKLSKVIVYGGTFGGASYNSLTIGDGTNTWKSVTVSGTSQTGTNTYTDGTALSGTGTIRITSNSGSSSNNGVRISKVEIFTMEDEYTYSDYCTMLSTKTLIAIQAGGTPAEFWKGDAFNHNGITVTALWDDESETDVTSSCTFTGYDMGTAGQQVVTVTYQEETAQYNILVKTIANTQAEAYTVAEAKAIIDAGKDLSTSVYVAGTVSQVDSYSDQYKSITYWISTDGTTTNQFEVYSGKNLNNTDFSAVEEVQVGDQVVIYGVIKKYSSTYEFDKNNYIVSLTRPAAKTITALTVSGTPTKTTYNVGDAFETAGLVVTATYDDETQAPITEGFDWEIDYGTGNEALVAGVTSVDVMVYTDEVMSEVLTVNGLTVNVPVTLTSIAVSGTPTKTEYYAGDAFETAGLVVTGHYSDGSDKEVTEGIEWTIDPEELALGTTSVDVIAGVGSVVSEIYTVEDLTVTKPDFETVTYNFSTFTSGANVELTDLDGFVITLKSNGGTNPAWSSSQARVYAKGSLSVKANNAIIKSIEYTYVVNANNKGVTPTIDGVAGNTTAGAWDAENKTWTGADEEVTFSTSGSAGNVGFTKLVIKYTESSKINTSLAWSADDAEVTIGADDNVFPTLTTTPVDLAGVTYESSNTEVATIAADGTITLVKAGETTITANYAGDAEHAAATSASYILTVNKAPFVPTIAAEGYEIVDFTKVYSNVPTNGTRDVVEYEGTSFAMEFAKDPSTANAPKYYENGNAVRAYVKNTITITAAEPITFVDINWAGNYVDGNVSISGTGTKTAVVKFSATCRFKSITVAYGAKATIAVNATAQYGTFCAPFAVEVPEGVTASTATLEGETIVLASVGETIPAKTPVVLYAEEGLAATNVYGREVAGTPTAGVLTGVYEETPAPNGSYVLQLQSGKVGFYQVDTEVATPSVGANRAYLTVPSSSNARAFFFDAETAISTIESLTSGKAEIYNLNGVKLNGLQKGINIVNGKKVLVK